MNFQEPISDRDIERSLWLIRNKPKIKKIIIFFLILIIFCLYGFSLFKFINIKIQDARTKNKEWGSVIDFNAWREKNKIKDLIIINKHIIALTNNKYDLVMEIENPNPKVAVSELKYQFLYNNQSTPEKATFLLPGQTKKIINFNIESNKIIRTMKLKIIDLKWKRIKTSELKNFNQNIITIQDQKIHSQNQKKYARNWIEFTAINKSPYNQKNINFYVSLYLGSKLVAINQIKINELKSEEKKHLEASWFQRIPSYAKLKIESEINFLDPINNHNYYN